MTTLVAIAEPGRDRDTSDPRPSALLLSALLHVLVAVLLLALAWLPPPEAAIPPQERTVEVVMVPAPAEPAQPAQPPPRELLNVTPPNLSDDARFGPESVLPPAPAVSQAERSEPSAEPPPTSPVPAPRLERSTPEEAAEPVLPPQQPEPAPPQQAAQPAEPTPPPPAPPPQPQAPHQMVIVVPPLQLEQPPRPEPPPRPQPQPRPQFQPRFQPEPRPAPQGRGELRELDLFGPGRQAPRQTAATSRAGAPGQLIQQASRTEGDFILRQVVRHWQLNYRDPRYRDMAFVPGSVELRADGTLAPPYGRNDPWDPYAMIVNYGELTARGREEERFVVDTFLTALRAAQPFQLPPTGGTYPRRIRMTFRLGDL